MSEIRVSETTSRATQIRHNELRGPPRLCFALGVTAFPLIPAREWRVNQSEHVGGATGLTIGASVSLTVRLLSGNDCTVRIQLMIIMTVGIHHGL